MDEGYDYVGGVRILRKDSWFRRNASRILNTLRERTTRIHMTDQGCMLRAYSRSIVDAINQCEEVNTFIPALAYSFASNPTEVEVAHEERTIGSTKYSMYKLMRLNFDLVTGFSLAPLQAFSLVGFIVAFASMGFVTIHSFHRLFRGEDAEGVFLSEIEGFEFFMFGLVLFGIGLLGEYIGRIYQEVLRRPRFIVSAVLEDLSGESIAAGGKDATRRANSVWKQALAEYQEPPLEREICQQRDADCDQQRHGPGIAAEPLHEAADQKRGCDIDAKVRQRRDIDRGRDQHRHDRAQLLPAREAGARFGFTKNPHKVDAARQQDDQADVERKEARARTLHRPANTSLDAAEHHHDGKQGNGNSDANLDAALDRTAVGAL